MRRILQSQLIIFVRTKREWTVTQQFTGSMGLKLDLHALL